MLELHGGTLRSSLAPDTALALEAQFVNNAMCGLTNDYVFTKAFTADDTNSWDPALDAEVAAIHADAGLGGLDSGLVSTFSPAFPGAIPAIHAAHPGRTPAIPAIHTAHPRRVTRFSFVPVAFGC